MFPFGAILTYERGPTEGVCQNRHSSVSLGSVFRGACCCTAGFWRA